MQGPVGNRGAMGPAGPTGVVANDFTELLLKIFNPYLLTSSAQTLARPLGGFVLKYESSAAKKISNVNVAKQVASDGSVSLVFYFSPSSGTVAGAHVATFGSSPNSDLAAGANQGPFTGMPSVTVNFESENCFEDAVSVGSTFFAGIRWN